MNTGPANTFLKHGEIMADLARSFIRRSILTKPKIEYKIDGSPVTNFDIEVEGILRKYIYDKYPEHGIIGEELTAVNPNSEFVWLVDPIDGTLAFLTGILVYGTLISLLHDGFPILGIIDIPMTGDRWVGQKNKKTLHNGRFIKTSDCNSLSEATLSTSSPDHYDETNLNVLKTLQSATIQTVYGGSCVAYGQIASGKIDLGIDANFDIRDFLPLVPIIEGAGGLLTNWQGETLSKESGTENMLASANSYLHDKALERINNL